MTYKFHILRLTCTVKNMYRIICSSGWLTNIDLQSTQVEIQKIISLRIPKKQIHMYWNYIKQYHMCRIQITLKYIVKFTFVEFTLKFIVKFKFTIFEIQKIKFMYSNSNLRISKNQIYMYVKNKKY